MALSVDLAKEALKELEFLATVNKPQRTSGERKGLGTSHLQVIRCKDL